MSYMSIINFIKQQTPNSRLLLITAFVQYATKASHKI